MDAAYGTLYVLSQRPKKDINVQNFEKIFELL